MSTTVPVLAAAPAIDICGVGMEFAGRSPLAKALPAKFPPAKASFARARAAARRIVLTDVSLRIAPGSLLCLLGPSGCGKTTLVNLVIGNLVPTSGTVTVLGEQAPYPSVRTRVGFMPQGEALYEDVTAEENLRFFGAMAGIRRRSELAEHVEEALAFARLEADRHRLVREFSGGMKRRLSLAVAMLASPDVLVLDEPTVGLDPGHRRRIWAELERRRRSGTTVLVTTHVMDEAARCSEIAMMRAGRIIARGTPEALMARTDTATLEDAFLALAADGAGRSEQSEPEEDAAS